MNDLSAITSDQFALPPNLISRLDVSRLVTEVEQLDGDLTAAMVRGKIGIATEGQLSLSPQLNDFLVANQMQIGDSAQRSRLIVLLRKLKDKAPIIHMTFATSADQNSLGQLVSWVRQTVHPQAVIAVGLQPGLIGGVYIRTPNQVHDLSVRAQLSGQRELLVREVEALGGGR